MFCVTWRCLVDWMNVYVYIFYSIWHTLLAVIRNVVLLTILQMKWFVRLIQFQKFRACHFGYIAYDPDDFVYFRPDCVRCLLISHKNRPHTLFLLTNSTKYIRFVIGILSWKYFFPCKNWWETQKCRSIMNELHK